MATLTKGKTFTNGETVTPQKLHELVDLGTVSGIVNADIAAGAAIADSKLAQITTAGKVANSATSATNANTANAIVARDASGNFAAGTITAALSGNAATATTAASCSGNAATATTLQTARTINGVSFNGSANITVTADPNAHTHDASAITSGTLSNLRTTATRDNTANAIVARDASGGFSSGTINASSLNTGTVQATSQLRIYPDGTGSKFFDAVPGNITVFKDATVSNSGILTLGCSFASNSGTAFIDFNRNYSFIGSITQSGTSSIAYNTTSDYRLKTNIEPLTAAVARLLQIPVHRFNWLADPTAPKVDGFLAHEAQAIVPESVTGHKDEVDDKGNPKYQGIDQSKLVPLLVAAVQELAARVAALEAR